MRILIVFNHPAPYKVSIFNELSKYVDLEVLFERNKAKNRPQQFYSNNDYKFKHFFLDNGYVGNEGSISNGVKNYIKKHHNDFDLIVMNGYSHLAEIKAIKWMHKNNVKFVLLINGGVVKKHELCFKKAYKASLIRKAAYFVSPSKASNDYLVYYKAIRDNIFNYIYSNYSESEIHSPSNEEKIQYRKKWNLPLDKKIFINPCQFIKRKNNIQLISLFVNRDDVLLLVGQGKELKHYRKYIKENKINNVIILPYQKKNDLWELYRASDVHITLSKEDIFGHTVLEAFACGIPVISSSKVISSLEYIHEGHNGYLVDINDKKSISSAMDQADEKMKDSAISTAKNNTFEQSGKSLYEAFKKIYEK